MNKQLTLTSSERTAALKNAEKLFTKLFPINRSLTGEGVRKTYQILSQLSAFTIHEIESGTTVFDWTVPPEWNINEAWIKDEKGRKIIDFAHSNLHVVGYSIAVDQHLHYSDLVAHLHTLPDKPDAIPYRTSYYDKNWGFCLPHTI